MTNNKELSTNDELTEFLLYTSPNGDIKIDILFHDENVWLTQKRMAELFGVDIRTISEHLQNVFNSHELEENQVIRKIRNTAEDGKSYLTNFYNLDAIISVGYRVNSSQATQFRIWATNTLKEYLIKGFVLDDERLKNGTNFGKHYFKELLERVRSIRASERRIWLQITDIFAEISTDYNEKGVDKTKQKEEFYSQIQNKFHFAITGHTAAEIIHSNVNSDQPYMGLTSWKNGPKGRILKSDVTTAKNYLEQKEIKSLERAVSSFFDYIEGLIERQRVFTMEEFAQSVDKFLAFNDYKILDNKGSISHHQAKQKAESEYDIFNITQKIDSDFEKFSKKIQAKSNKSK